MNARDIKGYICIFNGRAMWSTNDAISLRGRVLNTLSKMQIFGYYKKNIVVMTDGWYYYPRPTLLL